MALPAIVPAIAKGVGALGARRGAASLLSRGATRQAGNSSKLGKMGAMNLALGAGFVGMDTHRYMEEGDGFGTAATKALAINAAWAMVPGGFVTAAGVGVLASAPMIKEGIDNVGDNLTEQRGRFSQNFEHTGATYSMMQQDMQNMQMAQNQYLSRVANHARGQRKYY